MHNSKQYETIGLQDSGQLIACWTRCTVWSIHLIHSSSRFPSIGRSVQLLHGGFRERRVTGGGRGESAQMAQEFTPPPAPGGGPVPYCTGQLCLLCICAASLHWNAKTQIVHPSSCSSWRPCALLHWAAVPRIHASRYLCYTATLQCIETQCTDGTAHPSSCS